MTTFQVDLPPGLAGFIQRQVEAGLYSDAADVIRDALRRLADGDEVEAVRAALAPGVAEAEAGMYVAGDVMDAARRARASRGQE